MTIYNFTIKSRVGDIIGSGDGKLTLIANSDGSESFQFHAVITPITIPDFPSLPNPIFDLNGIGFLNSETFFSSQNGWILSYNLSTDILDLYNQIQTIQIQGVGSHVNPVVPTGLTDNVYNTYYNVGNESKSKIACACGGNGSGGACGGITNIINLNNRND